MKNAKIYEETLHHYGASVGEVRHEIINSAYVSLVEAELIRTLRYLEAEKRRYGWDWGEMIEVLLAFIPYRHEISYDHFATAYEQTGGEALALLQHLGGQSPKNKKSTRQLKIHTKHRQNTYSTTTVPIIKLEGRWLETLGFTSGQHIQVQQKRNQLIITLQSALP